jgi:hypothetical protein
MLTYLLYKFRSYKRVTRLGLANRNSVLCNKIASTAEWDDDTTKRLAVFWRYPIRIKLISTIYSKTLLLLLLPYYLLILYITIRLILKMTLFLSKRILCCVRSWALLGAPRFRRLVFSMQSCVYVRSFNYICCLLCNIYYVQT